MLIDDKATTIVFFKLALDIDVPETLAMLDDANFNVSEKILFYCKTYKNERSLSRILRVTFVQC